MKKSIFILILAISSFILNDCFTLGYQTGFGPQGAIFSFTKQGVGSNGSVQGPMTGKTCSFKLYTFFSIGDGSPDKAAKETGITNVYTVDKETFNILGLYSSLCSVVTGDNAPLKLASSSSKVDTSNFNDIVTLQNGQSLSNVKATISSDSVIVVTSDGRSTVYKKSEVKGIKKNKR
jgi:hypothetical protein